MALAGASAIIAPITAAEIAAGPPLGTRKGCARNIAPAWSSEARARAICSSWEGGACPRGLQLGLYPADLGERGIDLRGVHGPQR